MRKLVQNDSLTGKLSVSLKEFFLCFLPLTGKTPVSSSKCEFLSALTGVLPVRDAKSKVHDARARCESEMRDIRGHLKGDIYVYSDYCKKH